MFLNITSYLFLANQKDIFLMVIKIYFILLKISVQIFYRYYKIYIAIINEAIEDYKPFYNYIKNFYKKIIELKENRMKIMK